MLAKTKSKSRQLTSANVNAAPSQLYKYNFNYFLFLLAGPVATSKSYCPTPKTKKCYFYVCVGALVPV